MQSGLGSEQVMMTDRQLPYVTYNVMQHNNRNLLSSRWNIWAFEGLLGLFFPVKFNHLVIT